MATTLNLRSEQSTPLSNTQLDGNFTYLNDKLALKYDIADFTAANISDALNTPALISEGNYQTAIQLSESNAIDAWTVRTVAPTVLVPTVVNKTSIPIRDVDGKINATIFVGDLDGNADSATTATSADEALSLADSYTVPIALGGTGATTAQAARTSLQVLHTGGLNAMTAKLQLHTSSPAGASINFGQGDTPEPSYTVNGDMWIESIGVRYKANGLVQTVARVASPVFTGQPQAPDANGVSSQIATISHLASEVDDLNTAIALKSDINSPNFTGTPTADTASQTVISRRIATTQYVHTAVDNKATDLTTAYENYADDAVSALETAINNALALKSNLDSPYFTGTPTAVTPAYPDDSQKIATTAYVKSASDAIATSINSVVSSLTALINSTRPVPTGSVFYLATSTVPNGYLEANGAAVSRVAYSTLWQALGSPNTGNGSTTFNLPDLRGEFIRGWDNGRGVDASRALGSSQASDNLAHNHGMPGDDQLGWYGNGYGGWTSSSRGGFPYDARSSYGGGAQIYNTTTDGGSESRPRNVALMPIIKY